MNFREAAQELGRQVTTAEIAGALGVSVDAVRQARLQPGAAGYRRPPEGWEKPILKLAKQRTRQLERLIRALER